MAANDTEKMILIERRDRRGEEQGRAASEGGFARGTMDGIVGEARRAILEECDYEREANFQMRPAWRHGTSAPARAYARRSKRTLFTRFLLDRRRVCRCGRVVGCDFA